MIHDDARAIERTVWTSKCRNDSIAASFDGPKVDKQNLILAVVHDFAQQMAASRKIRARELTLEHRILQVIAKPAHRLVDLTQPQVV